MKYTGKKARARLNSVLANQFITDFAEHGGDVVAKLRQEKPVEYMKLMSAVLQQIGAEEPAQTPTYNVIERRVIRPENPNG